METLSTICSLVPMVIYPSHNLHAILVSLTASYQKPPSFPWWVRADSFHLHLPSAGLNSGVMAVLLLFFSWLCCEAGSILASWPGLNPRPPASGARSLSHWTPREVPGSLTLYSASVDPPASASLVKAKTKHAVTVRTSCCASFTPAVIFALADCLSHCLWSASSPHQSLCPWCCVCVLTCPEGSVL